MKKRNRKEDGWEDGITFPVWVGEFERLSWVSLYNSDGGGASGLKAS